MTQNIELVERGFRDTARWMHQTMWMVLVIATSLVLIIRRSTGPGNALLWIVGCMVMGMALSFAMRGVFQKRGHRATEEKILKNMQTYLHAVEEKAPAIRSEVTHAPAERAAVAQPIVGDAFVPSKAADFVRSAAPFEMASDGLVVFDAMPSRRPIDVRMNFFAVLLPVRPN